MATLGKGKDKTKGKREEIVSYIVWPSQHYSHPILSSVGDGHHSILKTIYFL